jgi:hypothetical protein
MATTDPTNSIFSPPSIFFPLLGAGIGYLFGKGEGENAPVNGWAILAGALGGALFNASSKIVDLKSNIAQASGASEFKGNVGGEAVSAMIGASDSHEPPGSAPAPHAVTGPAFGERHAGSGTGFSMRGQYTMEHDPTVRARAGAIPNFLRQR